MNTLPLCQLMSPLLFTLRSYKALGVDELDNIRWKRYRAWLINAGWEQETLVRVSELVDLGSN